MKIITIVGARPQFIKAAAVSRSFAKVESCQELIVHTGQHFDENMSDIFFEELQIPKPHLNLNIGGGTHGENTGKMIQALEQVLLSEKPDYVLVYGDTDSTLSGAIACSKLSPRLVHVEAGLRSFNMKMPEEVNRILTDHCSDILFTPTKFATEQLAKEGISESLVFEVGDVMYDAAKFHSDQAESSSQILKTLDLEPESYLVATVHRQENTDDPVRLMNVCKALANLSSQMDVVLPLHPRTKAKLNAGDLMSLLDGVKIVEPLGYLDTMMLLKNSRTVVTDSGGVQKEAYFCRKPCVTLRDETEWGELVEAGWNRLCSPSQSYEIISNEVSQVLDTKGLDIDLYGTADAGDKIVATLCQNL